MDLSTFEKHLRMDSLSAVAIARQYVLQPLSDTVEFLIYPNQSYDDSPRVGDEMTFPEESLPGGKCQGPLSVEQVVRSLWRNGKVPEWIDVAVQSEHDDCAFVGLRCCGRFTANYELLYHCYPDGIPPFLVKSPILPPEWENVETSGKFDFYWRKKRQRSAKSSTWLRRVPLLACPAVLR